MNKRFILQLLLSIFSSVLVIWGISYLLGTEHPKGEIIVKSDKSVNKYLNLTILLDLSDRIKQSDDVVKHDKAVIRNVITLFEERQKKFGFIASKDRLTIAIASQRNTTPSIDNIADVLVIDMANRMNKPKFNKKKNALLNNVDLLYDAALSSKTTGADIWSFFKDRVGNYIQEPIGKINYSNKMIILSDGYLVFDKNISFQRRQGTYMSISKIRNLRNSPDWQEKFEKSKMHLAPILNNYYHNLQVLMMGVEPFEPELNTNEFQIIEYTWRTFFEKMGIDFNIEIKEQSSSLNERIIESFFKKKA